MFGVSKDRLVRGLEVIRKAHCTYGGGAPCDCKYGVADELRPMVSEKGCGCPELAMARELLSKLSPAEFRRVCKRAKVTV